MMDKELNNLIVGEQTRFDAHGNPYTVATYAYFLGQHGPFRFELKQGENSPTAVEAQIAAKAEELRAVGALPAPSY